MRLKSPFKSIGRSALLFLAAQAAVPAAPIALQAPPQTPSGVARVVGTLQAINGSSLTVISDAGVTTPIAVDEATRFQQIEPGKTDLKEAVSIALLDLQTGDRVLVRGLLADDGKTIRAASIIAVKKAAIAEKQSKERSEWQRGVGGLVDSIDAQAGTISITTNGIAISKHVVVHFTKDTIFRRYAADSTRFDDAKVAPPSTIQPGDQLRARGARIAEGAEFNAVEVVSGTFRSIAGTVLSSDASAGSLVVQDLASKSSVNLKISHESQMRKLPTQFAEGLAARLKNQQASTAAAVPAGSGSAASAGSPTAGAAPAARGGDFQQIIARMPAATLADLQKGDVVMIVSTQGSAAEPPTVITLLAGVEPILRASAKGAQDMILSPWSLGGGEPAPN